VGTLHVHLATGVDAAAFPRLARGLLGLVAGARDPRLLVCELVGDAICLGRYQRARTAVRGFPTRFRRLGGGVAVSAGTGMIGVALAFPSLADVLAANVLNRWVRGMNAGLTRAGAPGVHYFGRDHVMSEGARLGVISQEITPAGEALFESIVAMDRPLTLPLKVSGYPTHGDRRITELRDTTLVELAERPLSFGVVAEAIAEGYAGHHRLRLARDASPPPEITQPLWPPVDEDDDEHGLEWSGVADVPIGFVEALARAEGGAIAAARLRGDFLMPSSLVAAMEQKVVGAAVDYGAIATRLQGVLAASPIGFLHGLKDVGILAEAILTAAQA
jgi:hypothetical protein